MEKITVEQVFSRQMKIDSLSQEKNKVKDIMTTEINKVEREYSDRIWDMENEKQKKLRLLETAQETFVNGMDGRIAEQNGLILRVQRILEYFRINTGKVLTIDDTLNLSRYAFQYQESLGYLLDADMMKIKLFIVGNRKPKNCYTLALLGKSAFGEELIKLPKSYGLDISSGDGWDIEEGLRDAASAEELKEFATRRRDTILKPLIEEYRKVWKEYVNVKQTYQLSEFEQLICFRCPDCNNFKTVWEGDYHYSPPQCYRHNPYVTMQKTLMFLTTEKLESEL